MTKTKTVPAARLTTPGAAEDWHTVAGLSGHYHPSIAVPLDQPGLISGELLRAFLDAHAETVKAAAAEWEAFRATQIDRGLGDIGPFQTPAPPVEIVQLGETKAEQHTKLAREQHARSSRALAKARRAGQANEPNVKAEVGAVTGTDEQEN